MSQLPSGEWVGKFSCGPAQGLRLKRALAAWSAPRPGKAIDADGVEHQIPDTRDLGARQMAACPRPGQRSSGERSDMPRAV